MPISRRTSFGLMAAAAWPARAVAGGMLHARVVDAETGAVIPCSVALRDSTGALVVENRSYTAGFRSTGEFRKPLAAGPARLSVSRGFDYIAEQRELTIRDGETAEVEIRLRRRSPLLKLGWLCGDHHVHMTHGESRIRVDFDYIALAARAEGLDQLSVGQFWNLPNPTATAAEAECRRVSTPDCSLHWNLEAPKNYYRGDASHCVGHCWFTGARATETIAQDLLGLSAADYESKKTPTPNFESHALIHRQGGVISYTHPCRWWTGEWGGRGGYPVEQRKFISNLAAELPFDTIAGPTYDGVDILMQTNEKQVNADGLRLWFLLLNHGYRVRATASSDATFDNEGRGTPGKVRIYSNGGQSFVTSGPLLLLDASGRTARVRAWGDQLAEVELIRNGEVVKTFPAGGVAAFEAECELGEEHGWVIARCFGRDRDHQVAITNPVFFDPPGWKPPAPDKATVGIAVTNAGRPVGGVCEVIEMIGREPKPLFRREFREGALELEAPATARLRVVAPGYKPLTRSIYLDSPAILQTTLAMRVEHLLDWSTYERLRRLLGEVRLEFPLEKA
jgi:hypothetical protein